MAQRQQKRLPKALATRKQQIREDYQMRFQPEKLLGVDEKSLDEAAVKADTMQKLATVALLKRGSQNFVRTGAVAPLSHMERRHLNKAVEAKLDYEKKEAQARQLQMFKQRREQELDRARFAKVIAAQAKMVAKSTVKNTAPKKAVKNLEKMRRADDTSMYDDFSSALSEALEANTFESDTMSDFSATCGHFGAAELAMIDAIRADVAFTEGITDLLPAAPTSVLNSSFESEAGSQSSTKATRASSQALRQVEPPILERYPSVPVDFDDDSYFQP